MNVLARRAFGATLRTQCLLAGLLCVSAWALRYWEAWLYCAIFAGASVINTAYFLWRAPALLRRRLQSGPVAETIARQRFVQAGAGLAIAAMFVLAGLDHRWGGAAPTRAGVYVADAVFVVALLLIFRVFRENGFAASTIRVETGQPVIATGPYRWVRHPMYTASALAFLATPPALGSTWAWLGALPACAALVPRLLDEERHLQRHLAGYRAYCRRVRFRLIPGVW